MMQCRAKNVTKKAKKSLIFITFNSLDFEIKGYQWGLTDFIRGNLLIQNTNANNTERKTYFLQIRALEKERSFV